MVKSPRPALRPRTRRLPPGARRDSLLDAALRAFAARGFSGTTTRDLARAAGVTEPVLYRHFPSKADLFAAVLEGAERRILARLAGALEGARGLRARLEALGGGLEPTLAALHDEFRVLNGAAATRGDPVTTAAVRATYVRLGAFLAGAFADLRLARGVDAEVLGHLLLEVGLGASLVRPLAVPVTVREGYGAAVLGLLARAVEPEDARGRAGRRR